jgi:hypothetical protein
VTAFAADMRLIWNNCMAYNAPGSAIYESSEELGESFEHLLRSTFSDIQLSIPKRARSANAVHEDEMDVVENPLVRDSRYAKLITAIKKDKRANFFLYPVDVSAAPGYLDVVKRPMDLSTVAERLEQGKYDYSESASAAAKSKMVTAFAADMRLIWNNCMAYNAPGSAIYESSEELGESFEHRFVALFGDEFSNLTSKSKKVKESKVPKNVSVSVKDDVHVKGKAAKVEAVVSKDKEKKDDVVERPKKKKEAKESDKVSTTGGYFIPTDFSAKRHRKLTAFMKTLINHPLAHRFAGTDGEKETFPPRNLKTIQNNLEYYCDKRIEEFMEHIHGVLEYVAKGTGSVDNDLHPFPHASLHNVHPSPLHSCIDTPTFYALILNKLQLDYFPSIHFKNWKDKKKVYLPLSVQVKSQSLVKKTAQNEMARAALVKVQTDMQTEAEEGTGTGGEICNAPDSIPVVEEDMFLLAPGDFEDLVAQVALGRSSAGAGADGEVEGAFDSKTCQHVRQYTSRYAQAGYRHWQAQFSGTFHEREGSFSNIKYANDMYKVIDLGKIVGKQSFATLEEEGMSHKSTYIFPLGYKCLRTLVLCLVPQDDIDRSRLKSGNTKHKSIQTPEAYSHVEVEFMSEIVSQSNNIADQSPYLLRISIGKNTTVVETPLTHAGSCKDTWMSALETARGPLILRALGAPLRRCRAVLNRLCTLPFIMPFIECIPISNQKASVAYYSATPAPMWLREVHSRLNQGTYEYVNDFAWDVRLVFTNCFDYNLPGSALYENAAKALNFFELLMCQWVYNVHDVSITDLAAGPWDMWMHLKYFDGHTNISSTLSREVTPSTDQAQPLQSPALRRAKDTTQAAADANRCCVTDSLGSSKQPLLFCELCEDSYASDVPEALEGETRQKMWLCRRCVAAADVEEAMRDPEVLLATAAPPSPRTPDVSSGGEGKSTSSVKEDDVDVDVPTQPAAGITLEQIISSSSSSSNIAPSVGGARVSSAYLNTDRYLPSPELGLGWCATRTKVNQKFLSPLGYHLSNSVEVYRHILDEIETHNDLLEARKEEFEVERARMSTTQVDGSSSSSSKKHKATLKKKKRSNVKGGNNVEVAVADTMLTTGKIAVYDNMAGHVCVWMGFIGEVEWPHQSYLPRASVQLQEARLAIKQSKMVTSSNISSLFSTWGRDPERKTYLSILNLEEREGGASQGTPRQMLTTAGLTGLDDPAIHFCVEGLEGLERTLACLNTPTLASSFGAGSTTNKPSYSYEYMYASPILAELQGHVKRVQERRVAMDQVCMTSSARVWPVLLCFALLCCTVQCNCNI